MKRICKKMIVTLMVTVMVFNFIMNPFCFAGGLEAVRDVISEILGTFVGIMTWPIRFVALGIGYAIDALAAGIAYVDGTVDGAAEQLIVTPFEIVFNEIAITNVDFFDFTGVGNDTVVYKIRTAVAGWYYFMRLIAIAILLVILVYVGIRMAISTVADDKAKYKKMLVDWLASLALVFVLQYIMVFLIEISNALVNAMSAARPEDFEGTLNQIAKEALGFSIEGLGATVVFFLFILQTFSILFSYINRMIRVAFLIIIAPLITITYSIDKMGDGKAQALNEWLKEFVTSILIQPFHCVIYMVFVTTSMDLLKNTTANGSSRLANTVIAILCMMFINDAEKIVRKIFSLNGDDNASSIAKGAAVAGAALHKSKDLGKAARKGVNMMKEAKPLQTGKKMFNEARSAATATRKTIADKISGRGGPGFATHYNEKMADIKDKADKKEEKKAEKKFERYGSRVLGVDKNGNVITNNSKVEAKKNELRNKQENQGLTDAMLTRKAKAELVREGKKKGDFSSAPIRAVRSSIYSAKRSARAFANSTTGKVAGQIVEGAFQFAGTSSALITEDLFTAGTTGLAVRGAVHEYMSSSNQVIANEVSEFNDAVGAKSVHEIEMIHSDFKSGKLEKDKKDSSDEVERRMKGIKKADGSDYSADEIKAAMSSISLGLKKKPNANMEELMADALNQSVTSLETQLDQAMKDAMQNLKTNTAKMGMAQAIDKGTSYGASVATIAEETIARSDLTTYAGDSRAIENLYSANKSMREVKHDKTSIETVIKKVTTSGGRIDDYIRRMEHERDSLAHEGLDATIEKEFKENYNNNINLLKDYMKSGSSK